MTASALRVFFDAAYLLALTAWVGSVLFFSFGVAPLIFGVLGAEVGGRFVRALFPRYYAWGVTCAAVALPAYLGVPLCYPEYRGPAVAVQALAILAGILLMLYAGNALTPAINAARDAGPEGADRFGRLHRRSVQLNALVLVIGLGLLVAHAARPAPRTSGIREMSPAERARYDAEIGEVLNAIEARQGAAEARRRAAGGPGAARPADEAERFPIDEATIRELVRIYARRRRPPAPLPAPAPAPTPR